MERFWANSIFKYLRVEPEDHFFLLTEPVSAARKGMFSTYLPLTSHLIHLKIEKIQLRLCSNLSTVLDSTLLCKLSLL